MNTKLLPIPFALALGFYQSAAWADPTEVTDIEELPATTVTATRAQMEQLQTPASVAIVSGQELQQRGGMKADLSEALQGIAGLSASNRHNYAQEVQLSSRGSRSGVRGIRLYVDGIPATMPAPLHTLKTDMPHSPPHCNGVWGKVRGSGRWRRSR